MDFQKEFKNALLSQPDCILGKSGITDEFIIHVTKLLKRYKIIKIKALKSIASRSNINEIAKEVSRLTNSHLLDVRGKKFILSLYPINKND
jgi:RNA-binding protein YhbY